MAPVPVLLVLTSHPVISDPSVEKVQREITAVVGSSRPVSVADRDNMPYTDAVIHEIQRIGNIVPLNLSRMATKDTQLGGYTIPKV